MCIRDSEEPESLEDVGSVLPAQTHAEEGFQIEGEGEPDSDDADVDDEGIGEDDEMVEEETEEIEEA